MLVDIDSTFVDPNIAAKHSDDNPIATALFGRQWSPPAPRRNSSIDELPFEKSCFGILFWCICRKHASIASW